MKRILGQYHLIRCRRGLMVLTLCPVVISCGTSKPEYVAVLPGVPPGDDS